MMPKEYIPREAVMPDRFCVGVSCKKCPFCDDPIKGGCKVARFIDAIPAADDVVGVPEWMTKDELLDILRAAREGRLKITAPPIETTCGSCRHFQPWPGMASGKCDCRMKRNRRGEPTGEVLYVTQSHKACRDDYERRADHG